MFRQLLTATFATFSLIATGPQLRAAEEQTQGYQGPGSDLWIEARLITTYSLNEHLNPLDIGVDAKDGVVTLTGGVENQAEKALAVRIAEGLEGVTKVEDQLEVGPEAGEGRLQNTLYRYVSDANVAASVEMRLLWNDTTGALDIGVDVEDGVVTLTGPVNTEEERQMAERIARRTEGVREVENKLRVAPQETLASEVRSAAQETGEEISDAWITAKVAAALRLDSTINHGGIDVTTQDGVVTLEGKVPTLLQKKDAAETARETSGVKRVENDLEVAHWR